jgi:hypothetical protein
LKEPRRKKRPKARKAIEPTVTPPTRSLKRRKEMKEKRMRARYISILIL